MALRNVIHRRNHKERGQLGHRRKLGLLEKHKDYVERARDHHSKQERLQRLQQKAALRNPDEFNFGMIRGADTQADPTKRGKRGGGATHVTRRTSIDATPLSNDLVAILKSQDLGYIRHAIRSEDKKIEGLKERIRPGLGMLRASWIDEKEGRRAMLQQHGFLQPEKNKRGGSGKTSAYSSSSPTQFIAAGGKKTVWVDSVQEARAFKSSTQSTLSAAKGKSKAKSSVDDDDDIVGYGIDDDNYGLSDFSDDQQDVGANDGNDDASEKSMTKLLNELRSRQQRLDSLHEARQKLETVRHLMTTKGTSVRNMQAKDTALRNVVAQGAKRTANGLALPGPDEGDDDSEDEGPLGGGGGAGSGGGKGKSKAKVWKWGRERKK